MNTFGNILAAREQKAKARGEVQGEKRILLQFVAQFWDDDEADWFARQLDGADHSHFPGIADLMQDQAVGHRPQLRHTGRTHSVK